MASSAQSPVDILSEIRYLQNQPNQIQSKSGSSCTYILHHIESIASSLCYLHVAANNLLHHVPHDPATVGRCVVWPYTPPCIDEMLGT